MRIVKAGIFVCLLFTHVHADQYACEPGVVDRIARAAAPSHIIVKPISDKNAKSCDFSINGEAVSASAATARAQSQATRAAIAAFQSMQFSAELEHDRGATVVSQLLFGTTDAPSQFRGDLASKDNRTGLRRCVIAFEKRESSDRKEIFFSSSRRLRCGFTGISAVSNVFSLDAVSAMLDLSKLYISVSTGEYQVIVFIPTPELR